MRADDDDLPDADGVYDTAPCALLLTNQAGLILRVNQTFCDWIGYPRDELVGVRKLHDLMTAGGRIFHQTHWMPLMGMQRSIAEVKLDFKTATGKIIPMVLNAVRREYAGVMLDQVSAFVIADRHRFEQQLISAKRQAEMALQDNLLIQQELALAKSRLSAALEMAQDRALFAEQMVGIVSHDLRNPLQVISIATERIGGDKIPPKLQGMLGHIREATRRAQRLIIDLLDFTQARVGHGLAVNKQSIDIRTVVDTSVEALRLVYPLTAIRFSSTGDATCDADPDRIAQLVGNLISNGATYGDKSKELNVSVDSTATDVVIKVHNHGIPIPLDAMCKLFEPMTRGTDIARTARSVGLGLFIVSEIAKAHRGSVVVASTAESGTTFTTTLPRAGSRY